MKTIKYKGAIYVEADSDFHKKMKGLVEILVEEISILNTKKAGGKSYDIDKHDIEERAKNIA